MDWDKSVSRRKIWKEQPTPRFFLKNIFPLRSSIFTTVFMSVRWNKKKSISDKICGPPAHTVNWHQWDHSKLTWTVLVYNVNSLHNLFSVEKYMFNNDYLYDCIYMLHKCKNFLFLYFLIKSNSINPVLTQRNLGRSLFPWPVVRTTQRLCHSKRTAVIVIVIQWMVLMCVPYSVC